MINKINKLSQSEFIKVFANIFENSAWIAEELYEQKPFESFEKMSLKMLKEKWKGFGWNTIECDGHKIDQLLKKLSIRSRNKPTAIIAKTVKGKGIKFMENNNDWHHGRLTQKLFEEAIKDL